MKLDEGDLRLLAMLGTESRTVEALSAALDVPTEALRERVSTLADNGLVDDRDEGRIERTESGRRVLVANATGTVDERVDTNPEVEAAIEELSLAPDEADAVRHAYALLRYWGRLTPEEIADAVYSEAPAGRGTPAEWWEEVVRDPLGALPGVEPPSEDDGAWRFAGRPEAGKPGSDGRRVLSSLHPVYGDVKHALESLALRADEREAARAAFGYLYRRGEATGTELAEEVYPRHPAGADSPDDWLEVVRRAFEALPGVERVDGTTWRFRRSRTSRRPDGEAEFSTGPPG